MNRFAFGKFEGASAVDLDLSDLRWLAGVAKSGDREIARAEISRRSGIAKFLERRRNPAVVSSYSRRQRKTQ